MSQSQPAIAFPRGPLIGVGALLAFAIACAGIGHLSGAAAPTPTTVPVASRDIRFADQADGTLLVSDARDGHVVTVIGRGADNFLRATMHGLARLRHREGVGPDPSFRLTAWRDGRLTLDDPTTGSRLDLEAFGATNEGAFARLLSARSAQP